MASNQIVVITDKRDAHLSYVQRHLKEPMLIIDPLEVAAGKTLSFEYSQKGMQTMFDGKLVDPKSVWFRKPGNIREHPLAIDPRYGEYAISATQKHFSTLMTAFTDAYWVSDLFAINRASDKPLQIAVAKELGLQVPDTLFSSDENAARAFVAAHDGCIIKPLVPFIEKVGENRQKTLYATKISSKKLPDLSGLYQSPLIFQQIIHPVYDVRVTVVGDKVFAARVTYSGEEQSVRDWRLGHFEGSLTIEPDKKFPKDIEQKCIEHVRRLGLHFGAIDFVADKHGVYWFLENNPNGQWAFVEKETGQPIGKAIADLLSAR